MGAVISCGAGGSMGALIAMDLGDPKIAHYTARLKDGWLDIWGSPLTDASVAGATR